MCTAGETKKVEQFRVFVCTSIWSIWAHVSGAVVLLEPSGEPEHARRLEHSAGRRGTVLLQSHSSLKSAMKLWLRCGERGSSGKIGVGPQLLLAGA